MNTQTTLTMWLWECRGSDKHNLFNKWEIGNLSVRPRVSSLVECSNHNRVWGAGCWQKEAWGHPVRSPALYFVWCQYPGGGTRWVTRSCCSARGADQWCSAWGSRTPLHNQCGERGFYCSLASLFYWPTVRGKLPDLCCWNYMPESGQRDELHTWGQWMGALHSSESYLWLLLLLPGVPGLSHGVGGHTGWAWYLDTGMLMWGYLENGCLIQR